MPTLLLTFLLIGIGWFLLIRPQQERARAQRALVAELAVGDRIISAGGIHGTVTAVAADSIELEVAPGVTLTLARAAVARRIEISTPDAEAEDDGPVEDTVKDDDGPIDGAGR